MSLTTLASLRTLTTLATLNSEFYDFLKTLMTLSTTLMSLMTLMTRAIGAEINSTFKSTSFDHVPCQRPYHIEHTGSRPITEVKQHRASSVLGWETAWEHLFN